MGTGLSRGRSFGTEVLRVLTDMCSYKSHDNKYYGFTVLCWTYEYLSWQYMCLQVSKTCQGTSTASLSPYSDTSLHLSPGSVLYCTLFSFPVSCFHHTWVTVFFVIGWWIRCIHNLRIYINLRVKTPDFYADEPNVITWRQLQDQSYTWRRYVLREWPPTTLSKVPYNTH